MLYLRFFLMGLVLIWMCVYGVVVALIRMKRDPLIIQACGRILYGGVRAITGFRYEIDHPEKLTAHQPCVFIANHQSGMDLVVYGSLVPPKTVVLGKKELIWIPLFGLVFYMTGNLFVDRKSRHRALSVLSSAVKEMKEKGLSLFVFPEGTRNRKGEPFLPFKKGAFHMAIQAGIPIVPLVCSPVKDLVSWRYRTIRPGVAKVMVLDPIETKGLSEKDIPMLIERATAQMTQAYQVLKYDHQSRISIA